MSTYSDASLIYYPSGYKAGKAYSLKPTDGSGDLTFTRASSATRVNAEGLIETASVLGSELVVNGDFATDSDWNKTGTWSIESNYATASGNSTSQYIQQDFTITNGKTYLFTYEIIENTLNGSGAALSGSGGFVQIFLSNVIGTHQVYITADDSGAAYALKIGVSATATTGTIKFDNVSVKEYTTLNVPRIDYTGGGCGKLLLEPQRTNLLTYSEDFSNASWTKQAGITATYNTTETLSPNGTYNATKFVGNGTTGVLKTSISVSGVVSRSVYLKSVTGTTTATFKEPNTNVPSPITLTITNEWQRFEMIGDNGSSLQGLQIDDITSDGIYMWGAQLEAGSYPTSYIPTTSTAVTRLADEASKTGISSLINSAEGVLYAEIAALYYGGNNRAIAISDGTSSNRVLVYYTTTTNQITALYTYSGTTQVSINETLTDSTQFIKFAFKYKENDCAFWINGIKVGTDNTATAFAADTLDTLRFDSGAGSSDFYGKCQNIMLFPTVLSDDDLTLLTGTLGETYFESYALMANYLNYTIQ
jgi:hypothetical protein